MFLERELQESVREGASAKVLHVAPGQPSIRCNSVEERRGTPGFAGIRL